MSLEQIKDYMHMIINDVIYHKRVLILVKIREERSSSQEHVNRGHQALK